MFCKICDKEFSEDKSGEGKFYAHLKFEHKISKKQYIILTEYGGQAPECVCGCRAEASWVNRLGFRKYSKGHRRFEHRVAQYIKDNGAPICAYSGCNKEVGFIRAEPKKHCDHSCAIMDNEKELRRRSNFMKNKMRDEEYLDRIRDGIGEYRAYCKKRGIKRILSEEHKQKISVRTKERMKDPELRRKLGAAIKKSINNNKAELQRRSDYMKDKMKETEYVNNVLSSIPNRFSKLHLKIREQLSLEEKGFISEQIVGRYIVDELNDTTKTIVEINGDYVHANPSIYSEYELIRLPGNSYTAAEKWESDKRKLDNLKGMGYTVIVIWESDNIDNVEI